MRPGSARRRIAELEAEVAGLRGLQARVDALSSGLANALAYAGNPVPPGLAATAGSGVGRPRFRHERIEASGLKLVQGERR